MTESYYRIRPTPYFTVDRLIYLISSPDVRRACLRMYEDNRELYAQVQGSSHNHQAWPGGYHDHVAEVMNIAVRLYWTLGACRPLPFTLGDLLLVVFLHDAEKPWKYEVGPDGELRHRPGMDTKEDHQRFRMRKLVEYGIELTPEQVNGLEYAEGEIKDYSSRERKMGPLAAVVHMCDICSARLWFDHPLSENDPWQGACRIQSRMV